MVTEVIAAVLFHAPKVFVTVAFVPEEKLSVLPPTA